MLARRLALAASLFLNLVLVYALVWGEGGIMAYKELRLRCEALEDRIRRTGEGNLEISKEIRLLQSDEKYIEKTIRNRLNFVRSNEILYIFPGESDGDPSGVLPNETKN